MATPQLSLDEIIAKVKKDGTLWDVDARDEPIVRYRFVFDEKTAEEIIVSLLGELANDKKIKKGWSTVRDRTYYATFDGDISVYLLDPSSQSSIKGDGKKPEHGKSLLVIDTLKRESDYEAQVLRVLNAFYSIYLGYKNTRTPLETSPAHLLSQNP